MATATIRSVFMGPRLRRLRRDLGLTQADMAADLDISAPTWRFWNATSGR